jgi:uncharacterized protein YcnI
MHVLKRAGLALGLTLLAGAAQAHISASPGQATSGSYQVVRFTVGHGCSETRATTAVRIEMPEGVPSARPQPKPGWALTIERASPAADAAVTAVTWRGRLPADQFDEFAVMFHLPAAEGPLYFPTVQTCDGDEAQWTEIPDPGDAARPERPAPMLTLTPAGAPEAGHHH